MARVIDVELSSQEQGKVPLWVNAIVFDTRDYDGDDPAIKFDFEKDKCSGGNAACLKAEAIFSDNNYLSSIEITKSDTTSDNNTFYYSNTNNIANIEVVLKDVCTSFFEIPYSSGIVPGAWTDKLWERFTGSVGEYKYKDDIYDCIAPYRAGRLNINDGTNRLVFYKDPLYPLECQDNEVYGTILENDVKTLFTKFNNYTLITPVNNNYSNTYSSGSPTDVSSSHPTGVASPQTASVTKTLDGKYAIGAVNAIGIGIQSSGNIDAKQSYEANLMFYAWADKSSMPIREIAIDWYGDGNGKKIDKYEAMAKNHKDECCADANNCNEFGKTPDACEQGFFQFNYVFSCNGVGSLGWNALGCNNACCFKPKVYIKDNWGWCNSGGSNVGIYAGDKSCTDLSPSSSAGVSYNGTIIIFP